LTLVGGTTTEREKRESLIMRGLVWLSKQPMADRPHSYVRPDDSLWLCALTDARADEERRAKDEATAWMNDL
jgi:hypothetical protein